MSRLRLGAIALLVVSATLFTIGTSAEKGTHTETGSEQPAGGVSSGEGGETAEQHAAEGASTSPLVAHGESGEAKILGIDRESNAVVGLAAGVSLLLAALLWFRPRRAVWAVVAGITLAFAVFDIAEVLHQIDVAMTGLALLAAAVGLAHIGSVVIAAIHLRAPDTV